MHCYWGVEVDLGIESGFQWDSEMMFQEKVSHTQNKIYSSMRLWVGLLASSPAGRGGGKSGRGGWRG